MADFITFVSGVKERLIEIRHVCQSHRQKDLRRCFLADAVSVKMRCTSRRAKLMHGLVGRGIDWPTFSNKNVFFTAATSRRKQPHGLTNR